MFRHRHSDRRTEYSSYDVPDQLKRLRDRLDGLTVVTVQLHTTCS